MLSTGTNVPAAPVPFAVVPTMVATCADHTDNFAVVYVFGFAPVCMKDEAAKKGKNLLGADMINFLYTLLDQPYWLPRG